MRHFPANTRLWRLTVTCPLLMRYRFLDLEWIQHPISAYASLRMSVDMPLACCRPPIDWLVMHLTVVQKHTLESVTVSPFFLPRVQSALDNLGHCRKQIWEALHPYAGTIDNPDY
ncbi:hypothetical protein ASPFODRAFT_53871 [Aspergillus luchuensis CBS 106.47]|uniref:Uncharacterized protein n=1 Tax=Aspergillus luchuensis (strain CBS 106.47) TaxID=1137211 RepID=A0A1M3T062_ASPLC|nr:hypothetical protein ASPFODRAFT_53871 [Aspergillus luchuensis CBS 106.47]